MNGVKILLILGTFAFFMFGCCSLTGDSTPYMPGVVPNYSSQPNQSTPIQPSQNDLSGQTFSVLAALGVPLECDITTTYEGTPTTMKLYMKGEDEMRTQIDAPGDCEKMAYIAKGNTFYMGCETGFIFADCNWYSITVEPSNYTTDPDPYSYTASTSSQPDFSSVPSSQIDCKPWIYDPSKFVPSGKVCDMNDLMNLSTYS
ncbi:MAG: hypothetical protein ABH842_03040 [Candidatus Micrarchaeota archaeon]